ncbi:MAG: hypothetical protein M1819_006129 [Sarea resinae]|nr:MAG: hypothetical protein M1819_006129 [Sarea resinae]
MVVKVLCVAEKPSIAKAVAQHLSGGHAPPRNVAGINWVKNYDFNFDFGPPWGQCAVTMTSVAGHIDRLEFEERYRSWKSCAPGQLFEAPLVSFVEKDKQPIAKNIEQQARHAKALFIWTDCDREGEHIGTEIRKIALKANPRLEVKRAKFSNIERAHVMQAARRPVNLDDLQANAVAARIELDLRIGAAFTRMQTLSLQTLGAQLQEGVISYGSCQFPTLGFVVDRYFRVKNFKPENFWAIKVVHRREEIDVHFLWDRVHLFDRMVVTVIFERCLTARTAKVSKMQKKPTSKWKPLPLTTVELQKNGSRFLHMDSQRVMKIAEDLYTKGFISYPRTETDQFDKDMDLRKLVEKQVHDSRWGNFAQEYAGQFERDMLWTQLIFYSLYNGNFKQPRSGRNNDHAHPPIHPVIYVTPDKLNNDERRVYEFVVRRFLACCSEDAKGEMTTVEIEYGEEKFHANGLLVLERNYLDVYPYEKWESSQQLPRFTSGETFEPTEANMTEGKTSPPGYLTEPELISLMDANGIGTDATMAEHIAKIKEREYVMTQSSGGRRAGSDGDGAEVRGGRRGGRGGRANRANRGGMDRGAGRGAQTASREGGNQTQVFIPSTLGVALIVGYDNVGFDVSLSKPFLRKEVSDAFSRFVSCSKLTYDEQMELKMKEICAGRKSRNDVVQESLEQYREVFVRTSQQIDVLKAACRRPTYYLLSKELDGCWVPQ